MAQIKCQIYLQPMISNSCPRARHARAHPGQAGKRRIAKIRRAQPRHTTGSGERGEHITTRRGDADAVARIEEAQARQVEAADPPPGRGRGDA